jgi:hypothetical protein
MSGSGRGSGASGSWARCGCLRWVGDDVGRATREVRLAERHGGAPRRGSPRRALRPEANPEQETRALNVYRSGSGSTASRAREQYEACPTVSHQARETGPNPPGGADMDNWRGPHLTADLDEKITRARMRRRQSWRSRPARSSSGTSSRSGSPVSPTRSRSSSRRRGDGSCRRWRGAAPQKGRVIGRVRLPEGPGQGRSGRCRASRRPRTIRGG